MKLAPIGDRHFQNKKSIMIANLSIPYKRQLARVQPCQG